MNIIDKTNQILIVSITPYFLEKQAFWFDENLDEILQSLKTQQFFQDNVIFLQKNKEYNFMQTLRKLDEMGYEKVFKVETPGEFSQIGGVIEIFPINTNQALRLDFLGNTVENIQLLQINPIRNTARASTPKGPFGRTVVSNGVKIEDKQGEWWKKSREIMKKKLKSQKLFSDLKNLKAGDYLVHLDHGVAKFSGIEKIDGQEYYTLEYSKKDRLFVPLGLERKLSRYVGFADPAVSRLGSALWQNTKRKIKENVEALAKELLALYSQKELVTRASYINDPFLEKELQAGFLYQETPDQINTIEDIKKDLLQEKPMDRIVCGDVGFGKTEIAIRTAFLAGINNRQTAIICPTTILANQHFNNFKERFKKLPFKIALLSRLQTKSQQKKIIQEIKEGKIDVVIGTHRLLSNDLEFKNLQLLIIDDEQRFGVKQKEKLRKTNPALDLLSLSATPIPRTIYLALSSFKNISLMQTPPQGRIAIHTKIKSYSKKEIQRAIDFELARNGQVYFLHNRVESIEKTKIKLQKLIPGAKLSHIHGRMQEKDIIKIMDDFQKGKTNVLVATTIIENGIDLPNVNTIIIEDASRLGLSQAYQIRGRVGRSHIKSFACLFYPKKLTPVAQERLRALYEARELGAGYQIALKDMELRGAGNILGKEQSGNINKIGLNLYCQMLAEVIEKMRN